MADPVWVLIPIAAIAYAAYEARLKTQRRIAEMNAVGESAQTKTLADTVKRLEDRVAVLERLAVDPAKRLADDIERLR
jgi:hypothetical protein